MLDIGAEFRQGQYIVLKKLAESGFLITYLAYMPFAGRLVTLVVLNQRYPDEADSQFFRSLVSITARLNHPNIAKIYEAGEEKGLHFYAQEYYLGTLQEYLDYLSEQSVDTLHLLPVLLRVCEVVEHCQSQKIVHCHLSPSEIYIGEGQQVLISNFCHELGEYSQRKITQPLPWTDSPYFSPEVAEELVNVNSDVFSVGAILYRIIVGEWSTPKTASKSSLELSTLEASLPRQLSDLVWKALVKDPDRRLQNVSQLKELLEGALSQSNSNTIVDDVVFWQWFENLSLPDTRKVDLITRFKKLWQRALDSIADEEALREILQNITTILSDVLWARGLKPKLLNFNRLYYGVVDQPLVKIRIPSSFPVIFVPLRTVDQRLIERIQDLIRTVMPPSEYFAVLVPLFPSEQFEALARESVYDLIVLDEDGLKEIIAAKNSSRQFVQTALKQVDLVSLSPYVTRGPVPRNMFFGREYEIKTIIQRIENSSISILGGRRIGKTSFLHCVEQILSEEEKWNVVYLDCQSVSNYEDFFSILNFATKTSLPGMAPKDFLRFLEYLQREYPGSFVVFLLDEVDALLSYDHKNDEVLSKLFRSLSQTHKCHFIFCGERGLEAREKDPVSPFFNFCHSISLRYLDRQAVTQIISEPMRYLGLTLPRADELFESTYRISSGHPNVVQYICHRLVESIAQTKRRVIVPADLTAIQTSYDFFEYFLEVIWGTATPLAKLISVLAETKDFTLDNIKQWLRGEGIEATEEQIIEAVDNLVLYAIFARRGAGEYTLTADSLPNIIQKHRSLETLKSSLGKEAKQWLKQSSNPKGH